MDPSALKIVENTPMLPTFQASRWRELCMLIEESELRTLFQESGNFRLFKIGSILAKDKLEISPESFIQEYCRYLEVLKSGRSDLLPPFHKLFSVMMTCDSEAVYASRLSENQFLIRSNAPTILIQSYSIHYSREENKFRSMLFGSDSISWGLMFAYPVLYRDPETMEVLKTTDRSRCPNTALFEGLIRGQRQLTVPTPFVVRETVLRVPMRIGKLCLPWIANHPQLVEAGIGVKN